MQTLTDTHRCQRCNREISNPNAMYGWRCAEILGIAQNLNHSGDGAFKRYMLGIKQARYFLEKNNIDVQKIDILKFYESYAKQYLATGLQDQALWFLAYADMIIALNSKLDKNGNPIYIKQKSPSLQTVLNEQDFADYKKGLLTTTAFIDNKFDLHVYLLQQKFNNRGYRDKFGDILKADGIFGSKTQWVNDMFDKEYNTVQYLYGDRYVWADDSTLQGIGILPNGVIVSGRNTDIETLKLAKQVQLQSKTYNNPTYGNEIDKLAVSIADKITFYGDKKLTAGQKRRKYISKIKNTEYYEIEDVTETMFGIMVRAEEEQQIYTKYPWPTTVYPVFYNEVENGSAVDLKNQEPFKNKSIFIYDNELVDQDALGNIFYGYLGKCYHIPNNIIFMGGGYAQISAKTSNTHWIETYFDDPRDVVRVRQGIELYNKYHPPKSR